MVQDLSITQNIPVSNHVFKYLISRCGQNGFVADRKSFIGCTVLSMLTRKNDIRQESKKKYTKSFSITIKEEEYLRNGVYISYKNAKAFNDLIDKMFREELYCHVMINKFKDNKAFVKSINTFLEVYNITEDDIKFETIYRGFKRKKDDIQEKLNIA